MNRAIAGIFLIWLSTLSAAASVADEAVFDKNKGRIDAVYARELKMNPGLQGRVVLEMKIAPDGHVTNCRVVSSEITIAGFGDKLCERTREFQFAPRPAATTFTKELSFFAAG